MTRRTFSLWLTVLLVTAGSVARAQYTTAQNQDNKLEQKGKQFVDQAMKCFSDIERLNSFVAAFDPSKQKDMPVGLSQNFGTATVTIAFSDRKDTLDYSEFSVFCKLMIPQGNTLYLGAQHVKYSRTGGLIGDATLALLGDVSLSFGGGKMTLTLKGADKMNVPDPKSLTYAKLECGGIKELGIAADLSFAPGMLVPLNADYTPNPAPDARVHSSFQTIVSDWNDILAEISLTPFGIRGLDGFAFVLDKAVFDFSDSRNSSDVVFPAGYDNVAPGNEKLWRGVYANRLKVMLPKQFSKKGSDERVSFEADRLIIDNSGISGTFSATNILTAGSASGWDFSVDSIAVSLRSNHLTGAGFDGHIGLPVSKAGNVQKTGLAYKAMIDEGGNYTVNVSNMGRISFDVFQATATIAPGSYLELKVQDGRFRPKAVLSGSLTIGATKQTASDAEPADGKQMLAVKGIEFQELTLQTVAPYVQVKYCGYKGDVRFGNFPLTLSDIGMGSSGNDIWLGFGAQVNLMEDKITGETHLKLTGTLRDEDNSRRFAFKGIEVDEVYVNANFGTVSLEGTVAFNRNHPIMGNGFSGKLNMDIKLGKTIHVEAATAFGSKPAEGQNSAFRYYYIDGLASGFSIPVGAGISFTGFGGGLAYHMKRDASTGQPPTVSPSGLNFIPDSKSGMSFRAGILFKVGSEKACTGEAGLELVFTNSWGLASLGLFGKAYVMPSDKINKAFNVGGMQDKMQKSLTGLTKNLTGADENTFKQNALAGKFTDMAQKYPTDSKVGDQGSIVALAGINFDFANKSFDANLDLYVSLAGGMVRGRGADNRAGWAQMHFGPDAWFVYLGTPSDRLGLRVGVGSFSLQAGGYLMLGSKIPGSPPPPAEVADILHMSRNDLDYMKDMNALGEGKGFAFGADFSVKTGDITFLIFYANFMAGMGFDFMLKNYGDAHCAGSSEPVGINGWFANGQAYAYFQGDIGIKIKLFFVRKKISILKIAAAALLQAKFPNPSWFRGFVGGHFSVLGGMVSGHCNFKITIGEECDIVGAGGSPLEGIKMISDFKPDDQSDNVDVFATPQAVFNSPVNSPFKVDEEDGSTSMYRINLDTYTLTANGKTLQGKLIWNARKDAVSFESDEILPPKTTIKGVVKVAFEKQDGSGWNAVYDNGQKALETKEVTFITGTAPENIPLSNIAFAYPVTGQKYCYPRESDKGYVQLKRGQAYLFSDASYTNKLNLTKEGKALEGSLAYDSIGKRVQLSLPSLSNSSDYELSLTGTPRAQADNVVQQSTTVSHDEDNDVQVAANKAAGTGVSDKPRNYLTYTFSTSRFNTLKEKIASKTPVRIHYEIITGDVGALHAEVAAGEPFDEAELTGNAYTGNRPLIQPVVIPADDWFTKDLDALVYSGYPQTAGVALTRDTTVAGLIPLRSAEVLSWYATDLKADPNNAYLSTYLPHRYNAAYYYNKDFRDLQQQIVNLYVKNPSIATDKTRNIIQSAFPRMRGCNYFELYRYIMPDGKQGSSQRVTLANPVI
jgi:hypothetical protein